MLAEIGIAIAAILCVGGLIWVKHLPSTQPVRDRLAPPKRRPSAPHLVMSESTAINWEIEEFVVNWVRKRHPKTFWPSGLQLTLREVRRLEYALFRKYRVSTGLRVLEKPTVREVVAHASRAVRTARKLA